MKIIPFLIAVAALVFSSSTISSLQAQESYNSNGLITLAVEKLRADARTQYLTCRFAFALREASEHYEMGEKLSGAAMVVSYRLKDEFTYDFRYLPAGLLEEMVETRLVDARNGCLARISALKN